MFSYSSSPFSYVIFLFSSSLEVLFCLFSRGPRNNPRFVTVGRSTISGISGLGKWSPSPTGDPRLRDPSWFFLTESIGPGAQRSRGRLSLCKPNSISAIDQAHLRAKAAFALQGARTPQFGRYVYPILAEERPVSSQGRHTT